ncbi:MAG: ribbon-helix-helix protein, CopG family [Crenarchaeota archaeon]|nr:ribbon-helix-helix protein, CopG family [Thermoproteota archaeon]
MSVRFGVALPQELAARLDEIARKLNITRSKVVEMAVATFLDYLSAMEDPKKSKLLVIVTPRDDVDKVIRLVKDSMLQGCMGFGKNFAFVVVKVEGDTKKIMSRLKGIKGSFHPIVLP